MKFVNIMGIVVFPARAGMIRDSSPRKNEVIWYSPRERG